MAELKTDLALSDKLVELINSIFSEEPVKDVSIVGVIDALKEILQEWPAKSDIRPRLAICCRERMSEHAVNELREAVSYVLSGAASYILGTADLSRKDRLFPADMAVFSTNPLSVAHGAAGVVYTLRRLTGEICKDYVDWMLAEPMYNQDYPPGLYLGKAGIAWVLDEIGYRELAYRLFDEAASHKILWDSPDVLYGASGFGLFCLKMWCRTKDDRFLQKAAQIGEWLKSTAVEDTFDAKWVALDGNIYIGYASGGSGVALFLLYLSLATNDMSFSLLGRKALNFDLNQGRWANDLFLGFPKEIGGDCSPYWSVGTAGILTSAVRYHEVFSDNSLLALIKTFEIDLMHKYTQFPQLFMGLAGLGNCLLDMWQFIREEKYLKCAWQSAEGIMMHRIVRKEGVTFPGTRSLRESADFATGVSGVALFLKRLVEADKHPTDCADNFNFLADELLPSRSYCARAAA